MNKRSEILRATREAASVFDGFPNGNRTSFDIVGAVTKLGIPLLFRPLDTILGALVAINGVRGIMVTTKRNLHVQRFTLAHELGHFLLGHEWSLDQTTELSGQNAPTSQSAEEVAANTFASELLSPKRLVLQSARRQGWTKQKLHQRNNIYQLSLRLGLSYQATCWALVTCGIFTHADANRYQSAPVKDRKRALAPATLITSPWADVWALTIADTGTSLEAGPDDLFAVHVRDHASAGYLWQLVEAGTNAHIVGESPPSSDHAYGEPSSKVLYVRCSAPGKHRLVFKHVRPWSGDTLAQIEIDIDGHGKERGGFARQAKLGALSIAA